MKKLAALFLLAALLLPLFPQASHAQDWHRDQHWRDNIHHFNAHDINYWHSGHWFQGPHGGRNGWWWVLGSSFYFYPAPVYPYPNPYVPPAVTVAVPAPALVVGAPVPVATYYYCRSPRGYYPYVPACTRPWRMVTAH